MRVRASFSILVVGLFMPAGLVAKDSTRGAIPNWPAPSIWRPDSLGRGVGTMGDLTPPLPFVAVTPCRIADTRGNGFAGAYGPPALAANATRTFTIIGRCGIPASAAAVSFNFGALNVGGAGDLRIFPAGGAVPLVSTLNYSAGTPNIANAAIVPLGNSGGITVQADAVSIDLIIDVNGYYSGSAADQTVSFHVTNNGGFAEPAIWGETLSTSPKACGLYGLSANNTGATFGVSGVNFSNSDGAAAVFGELPPAPTSAAYKAAGVRGQSSLSGGYGVLGISRSGSGVGAALVDGSGNQILYALLAAAGSPNYAVFGGGDFGGTGAKYFVEPHPSDASKVIRYVALEGPEAGTYFRGRGRFQNGRAVIEVPEDFRMVTDAEGLTIQITPIGEFAGVAVVEISLDGIVVKSTRNVEFFYTVNGVRRTHRDLRPVAAGEEYMPASADARIPAYLTDGQKAMLVSNGTYREDGTVNLETARRLGWDRIWEERQRAPESR